MFLPVVGGLVSGTKVAYVDGPRVPRLAEFIPRIDAAIRLLTDTPVASEATARLQSEPALQLMVNVAKRTIILDGKTFDKISSPQATSLAQSAGRSSRRVGRTTSN